MGKRYPYVHWSSPSPRSYCRRRKGKIAVIKEVNSCLLETPSKWFEAPHGFAGHSANAYEDPETGEIVLQMAHGKKNTFFWWPDKDGNAPNPQEISLNLREWHINPRATDMTLPEGEILVDENLEFARIDDRVATKENHVVFFCLMDSTAGTDFPFVMQRAVSPRFL